MSSEETKKTEQFICMMKPTRSDLQKTMTEKEGGVFEQHSEYLKQQFADGNIVLAGPSCEEHEEHFAIVVLDVEDKERARGIMEADPAVAGGLLTSHVTEFNIFLARNI